jgi:hypothetical protein
MCFKSGGGGGPTYVQQWDPETGSIMVGEAGVPLSYLKRGITSVSEYQSTVQQELSDKQLAAQKDIADKQNTFNQQQFDYQKALDERQRQEAADQATRQTTYDTGRAQLLSEGQGQIDQAFSRFTPDYFKGYTQDYMSKIQDQLAQQKREASKEVTFDAARRGLTGSQSLVNKFGLMSELEGRTLADQTDTAQNQANTLQTNVANTKQNLLDQVRSAESIGSPIAGGDLGTVGDQLQTQRQAISGVTNTAGDTVASLNAVPTVNTLGSIFGSLLNSAGSYLGGLNQNAIYKAAGLGSPSPFNRS